MVAATSSSVILYTGRIRIAYCTNVRLPSERAHGHQVARVCDALAKLGHEVTIFAPYRKNAITQDYWEFHKADRNVKLEYLGSFDPIDHPWIPKFLQLPILNLIFKGALTQKITDFDLLYTRTPAILPALLSAKKKIILELHTLPNHNRAAFVTFCNRCTLIACLTTPMKNELEGWGVTAHVIAEPDATNLGHHSTAHPKEGQIGYAGQLQSMGLSKGIPELIEAFHILHAAGRKVHVAIAAPETPNQELMKLVRGPGVHYAGFLLHEQIPHFLAECSILVYPAPKSDHVFYVRDTSPLKLFEYMASGRPIVTADLPPIRDVLDESTAFFCNPGDPADLARAISDVLDHPEEAKERAEAARKKVENYTWDKRMKRILDSAAVAAGDSISHS